MPMYVADDLAHMGKIIVGQIRIFLGKDSDDAPAARMTDASPDPFPSLPVQPTDLLSFVASQALSSAALMFTAFAKSLRTFLRSIPGMSPRSQEAAQFQYGGKTVTCARRALRP